jgi:hypothetical protein
MLTAREEGFEELMAHIEIPNISDSGCPSTRDQGVTPFPGILAVDFLRLTHRAPGILYGMSTDAAHVTGTSGNISNAGRVALNRPRGARRPTSPHSLGAAGREEMEHQP